METQGCPNKERGLAAEEPHDAFFFPDGVSEPKVPTFNGTDAAIFWLIINPTLMSQTFQYEQRTF